MPRWETRRQREKERERERERRHGRVLPLDERSGRQPIARRGRGRGRLGGWVVESMATPLPFSQGEGCFSRRRRERGEAMHSREDGHPLASLEGERGPL